MSVRHEWRGRAAFAEAAEAVGVATSDVLALVPDDAGFRVLWTTDTESPTALRLWGATLRRDSSGILSLASVAVELDASWLRAL